MTDRQSMTADSDPPPPRLEDLVSRATAGQVIVDALEQ